MSRVLWIVGEPGVGKTTLVRELIGRAGPLIHRIERPKWDLYNGRLAAAGHYKGDRFDGADTIPPSDIKATLEYWKRNLRAVPLTIFDGDKFSNGNALNFLQQAGADPFCVWLTDQPHRVEERRRARGTNQNATWVAGRRTKARRFSGLFGDRTRWIPVEGDPPVARLADEVLRHVGMSW